MDMWATWYGMWQKIEVSQSEDFVIWNWERFG